MSDRGRKVGLLVGKENTFPEPFLDLVEQVPEVTLRLVTLVSRRLRRLNRFTAELPGPPHALPREPDL